MRNLVTGILTGPLHRLRSWYHDLTRRDRFTRIFLAGGFGGQASRSGPGSDLQQTAKIRTALPRLLAELDVHSLLDIPCGDLHWMQSVPLEGIQYIGADIVKPLVAITAARYGNSSRQFLVLDLVSDELPLADLVLCRDGLVHLSFRAIHRAIRNLIASHATYLLATTFPGRANQDCVTGEWRALNLEAPPFLFPPPLRLINEGCTEAAGAFADKSLGLWRIADLPPLG
jgi:hypothetical protein